MPSATTELHVADLARGLRFELAEPSGLTTATCWSGAEFQCEPGRTYFGFTPSGHAVLQATCGEFPLAAGMYFCAQGEARIRGGQGLVVTKDGFEGFFHLGGPIESRGRLGYIDGCTDSLLIPPVRRGDPCLNLLHVPPRVSQTVHTHPSGRIGLIVSGEGRCETETGAETLRPGSVFLIPAGVRHSFHTGDDQLLIVAYHPDSDFGPTDEDHPMINRTLVSESAIQS